MKPLSAKRVMAILLENGFIVSRQKGSHVIFRNPATKATVPVAFHNKSKLIPLGTFLAIVKQSKLPREKFRR